VIIGTQVPDQEHISCHYLFGLLDRDRVDAEQLEGAVLHPGGFGVQDEGVAVMSATKDSLQLLCEVISPNFPLQFGFITNPRYLNHPPLARERLVAMPGIVLT
jgi:hypothetical protein